MTGSMTGPVLTYAIPFYRDVAYLQAALDSVVAQTDPRWRAVVIDDAGPEPEAGELVERCRDERITYVRNDENLGLAGNWNRCLDVTTTALVTILHADDALEPGYGEAVVAAHNRHPGAVAVHTRARIIGAAGQPVRSTPDAVKHWIRPSGDGDLVTGGDAGLASLLRGDFVMCPTLCYRRSRMGGRRFDDRWRMVLDLAFLAELLLDGDHVVGTSEVVYRYRRHPASETSLLNATAERFHEELALYDELALRAATKGWQASAATARRKRIVRAHLAYRAAGDVVRGRWGPARVKLELLRGATRSG